MSRQEISKRRLVSEEKVRHVQYGRNSYRIVQAWHYLDSGEEYHYIIVYKHGLRSYHHFAWIVRKDGSWIWAP